VVGKSEGSSNRIVEEVCDVSKRHPLGLLHVVLIVLERCGHVKN